MRPKVTIKAYMFEFNSIEKLFVYKDWFTWYSETLVIGSKYPKMSSVSVQDAFGLGYGDDGGATMVVP